jgi:hypothetical protein
MAGLFEDDFGQDESPIEDIDITTTILYYSEKELDEFKKLVKAGIKKELGTQAMERGNISDLLLIVLRKNYAETNS